MAKRHSAAAPPASLPLRVNDLLFVNAYFQHDRSAVQAYRMSHPKASYATARVEAYRVLAKPSVKAEIARRVQHEAGITKAMVESTLLQALAWANEKHDHLATASIAMDCAKLAGFLVDKKQDVTPVPTLTEPQLADELRKRGFVSVPTN